MVEAVKAKDFQGKVEIKGKSKTLVWSVLRCLQEVEQERGVEDMKMMHVTSGKNNNMHVNLKKACSNEHHSKPI